MLTADDSDAVKALVADAKKAIDAVQFDSKKTLAQNEAEIDAIEAELKTKIDTTRADEATAKLVNAAKVKLTKAKALKSGKVKLYFKGVTVNGKKVTSYQIYRKVKGGKYKKVATIKGTKKSNTWKNAKHLKKGKKYSYKVRGRVKLSNGKYVYTKWSKVKSVKCKKTRR